MDANHDSLDVNVTENPLANQDVYASTTTPNGSSVIKSVRKSVKSSTKRAFKLDEDEQSQKLWDQRKDRLLTRTCGKKKLVPSRGIEVTMGDDVTDSGEVQTDYRAPAWYVAWTGLNKASKDVKRKLSKKKAAQPDANGETVIPLQMQGGGEDAVDGLQERIRDTITPYKPKPRSKCVFEDHRPFFTYFLIITQTIILLISLIVYGFGPVGIFSNTRNEKVMVPSMSLQQVDFEESQNIWFGPPAVSLIHMGAKYSPCMRYDRHIYDMHQQQIQEERESACCIRSDESGCAQTTRERCSDRVSVWRKWTPEKPGPTYKVDLDIAGRLVVKNRTSGTVCGQDPRFCNLPASTPPNEWPNDITQWPICLEPLRPRLSVPHMSCEVIARPCCFGIHGQCVITTQEFCEFVSGNFHEEATLCSQVSCMNDLCRLLPFEFPNQWYRLITSLFIHAGILHLGMSLVFYYFYLDPMECFLGPARTVTIYLFSGIGGNLLSAAFVPYRAEVGPAGSIMGMMGCLLVIIWNCWDSKLEDPSRQLINKLGVTAFFFLCGLLLPFIDNYAHIGGFIVGISLSVALVPYSMTGRNVEYETRKKTIAITGGLIVFFFMFITFILILYIFPIYECSWCKYLNCLLAVFDDSFCPDQDIKIKRFHVL